jgi:plastocyanin
MIRRRAVALVLASILVAGCAAGGGGSVEPSTSALATTAANATPTPSSTPTASASAAPSPSAAVVPGSPDPSVCIGSTDDPVVRVTIEDFAFQPSLVQAETGEVITFSNTGFESHNATLDSGACATPTLETAGRAGLVFATTGEFPFHCTVHAWMAGTIVIAASARVGGPGSSGATGAPVPPGRSGDLRGEQRGT